jgi:uncharacterized glyoxalase superfamily protein PhnB
MQKKYSVHKNPEGTIMHADLQIGDSHLMLSDPTDQFQALPTMVYVYSEDCDTMYKNAIAAGGTSLRERLMNFMATEVVV